ncbi:18009_t:CDS:1, partial [Gigaspora margarita]
LEADSNSVKNNIINEKTIKLQKQKPNSYAYALIQTDEKLKKKLLAKLRTQLQSHRKAYNKIWKKLLS